MVIGTIAGSETGVQAIELLKKVADVDLVVGSVSVIEFTGISLFCAWESWMTLRAKARTSWSSYPLLGAIVIALRLLNSHHQ